MEHPTTATAPAPRPATPPGRPGPRPPAAAPDWWRTTSALAAWFGLAVVVGLWLSGGGLSGLSGTGVAMTSAGRLAGLLASALMLIQVLLMARLPFLERSYGQDELARLHRLVGFTSFNLLLAHVVLVLIGYAQTARRGALAETWDVVTTYPGMLLAVAGFVALVVVVVTSLRAARRRLRYESWHLLHLYAYLGAGLALPHQLWTGQDFVTSPLARAYWWTIWLGTLAAVLVYRLGLPLVRSLRHQLVVDRVVAESPDVVSVYVSGRRLDRLPVRAGQFFQWRFLDGAGWSAAHPYSLSAAPTADGLRLTARDVDGSGRLASLRPGTRARGRDSWLPQSAAHLSDAEALRHVVPDIAEHDVYLCGADGWMRAARAAVLDAGVPASHVHLERFSW